MRNNYLAEIYFQHMTKRSFEEAQNNTGNTEGLMSLTPTYLDLQEKIK